MNGTGFAVTALSGFHRFCGQKRALSDTPFPHLPQATSVSWASRAGLVEPGGDVEKTLEAVRTVPVVLRAFFSRAARWNGHSHAKQNDAVAGFIAPHFLHASSVVGAMRPHLTMKFRIFPAL